MYLHKCFARLLMIWLIWNQGREAIQSWLQSGIDKYISTRECEGERQDRPGYPTNLRYNCMTYVGTCETSMIQVTVVNTKQRQCPTEMENVLYITTPRLFRWYSGADSEMLNVMLHL